MTGQVDTKQALLEALEETKGIVTDAIRKVGKIARSTFYEWLKDDAEFKAKVDEIQDVALDFVEGKLFEKINGVQVRKSVDSETGEDIVYDLPPSDVAITFYLKTKGKRRGYVERQEIVGPDGAGFFSDKTEGELKEMLQQVIQKLQ
jgi:hypothetical protein